MYVLFQALLQVWATLLTAQTLKASTPMIVTPKVAASLAATPLATAPLAATPNAAAPLAAAPLAATLTSTTDALLQEVLQNLHIPGRSVDLTFDVSHAVQEAPRRVAATLREHCLSPQPLQVLAMPDLHGVQLLLQSTDPLAVVLLLPPQVLHTVLQTLA